jgi:hypothetical protein
MGLCTIPDLRPARGTRRTVALLSLSAAIACALSAPRAAAQDSRLSTVDLVQTQLTIPAKVTAGKRFIVIDVVENTGETPATNTITGFCLSKTDACGPDALKLAARRVPQLAPGETHTGNSPLTVPEKVPPGTYYLVVTANANNDVEERYRGNNVRAQKFEVEAKKK